MKTSPDNIRRSVPLPSRLETGYLLIECLVYTLVLVLLLGVAYAAFYHCIQNSYALRRNASDLASALRAGERWRADIRSAADGIEIQSSPEGPLLHLNSRRGPVDYQFTSNAVLRRVQSGSWLTVLENVQASAMEADARTNVSAWRWELELQPRLKKPGRVRPLFTFLAVPERMPAP